MCRLSVTGSEPRTGIQRSGKTYAGPSDGKIMYSHAPAHHMNELPLMNAARTRRLGCDRMNMNAMCRLAKKICAYAASKNQSTRGLEKTLSVKTTGDNPPEITRSISHTCLS